MKFGLFLSFALGASVVPAAAGGDGINFGLSDVTAPRAIKLGTSDTLCADMHKLADGINHNIAIQRQALSTLARVEAAVDSKSGAFATAKAALLGNMDAMEHVRAANQQIHGAPATVVQGLKTVAEKQAEEESLVRSLGGTSADIKTIGTPRTMFMNGIVLNQNNAKNAFQGCQGK